MPGQSPVLLPLGQLPPAASTSLKRPLDNDAAPEVVKKTQRVSRESLVVEMAMQDRIILPITKFKSCLRILSSSEVLQNYIDYIFTTSLQDFTDHQKRLKYNLTLMAIIADMGDITKAQKEHARNLLSASFQTYKEFSVLLDCMQSGEMSDDEVKEVLIDRFRTDSVSMFLDMDLINALISFSPWTQDLHGIIQEQIKSDNICNLERLFIALALTKNREIVPHIFELCFSQVSLSKKIELFAIYARTQLNYKPPSKESIYTFSLDTLNKLKEEMRADARFAPSAFERAFSFHNPLLHLNAFAGSYYILLYGALIEDADASFAFEARRSGHSSNFLHFDQAAISLSHASAKMKTLEEKIEPPAIEEAMSEDMSPMQFFLRINKKATQSQTIMWLSQKTGDITEPSKKSAAIILLVRAVTYHMMTLGFPDHSPYKLFLPLLEQMPGYQANDFLQVFYESIRSFEDPEAKRLSGILAYQCAATFFEFDKAFEDLRFYPDDIHASFYHLCIAAPNPNYSIESKQFFIDQLVQLYKKQEGWDEERVKDIRSTFKFMCYLEDAYFKAAFMIFSKKGDKFSYYSKLQEALCFPITYFLIRNRQNPEYTPYFDSFVHQIEELNRRGFPSASFCLAALFEEGLRQEEVQPAVVTRFVDEKGVRVTESLLTPPPPVPECEIYTTESLDQLIMSYTGCFADLISQLGNFTDNQREKLAERYEKKYEHLSRQERVDGLLEQEEANKKEFLESRYQLPFDQLSDAQLAEGNANYISPLKLQCTDYIFTQIGIYLTDGEVSGVSAKQKHRIAKMVSHLFRHFETLGDRDRKTAIKDVLIEINACSVRINQAVEEAYRFHMQKIEGMDVKDVIKTHVVLAILWNDYLDGQLCTNAGKEGPAVHERLHYKNIMLSALNLLPEGDEIFKDPYRIFLMHLKTPQQVVDRALKDHLTADKMIKRLSILFNESQDSTDNKTIFNFFMKQFCDLGFQLELDDNYRLNISDAEWRQFLVRIDCIEVANKMAISNLVS